MQIEVWHVAALIVVPLVEGILLLGAIVIINRNNIRHLEDRAREAKDDLKHELREFRGEFQKHEDESVDYRERQVRLEEQVKNLHKRLDRANINGRETR